MQRALNLLRGIARVEIVCRYPERFLNLCAANGIELWGIERSETGTAGGGAGVPGSAAAEMRAYMRIEGFRRLRSLSIERGFELRRVARRGAPPAIRRLRRRYVLVAGLAMCALLTRALSLFVWDIRVAGNERVPARTILEELKTLGFSYGSFGPGVKSEELADKLILKIPELSWFAVNIRGSRADVLVRERIPKPEIVYGDTPAMVIASKSGLITKISVLEGMALVKPGDTAEKGDLLVTGILPGRASGSRAAHALAEIEARTWYEMSAQMPSETVVKRYTGEKKRRRAIIIAGKKINLYFNSRIPWAVCDKMTDRQGFALPGGVVLPLSLVTESYSRYEPLAAKQDAKRAETILKRGLAERLRDAVGSGGVLAASWETREEGGVVTVTLRAECREQIAESRGFTDEERERAGMR
ncbi:MAG: sporulation protein YqfD [Oscillospiraceae bacterium]|jgi:similar to stage IV sporulation protein|nr:sporulation protein YqfD [Oscillospiraceae bacterium]